MFDFNSKGCPNKYYERKLKMGFGSNSHLHVTEKELVSHGFSGRTYNHLVALRYLSQLTRKLEIDRRCLSLRIKATSPPPRINVLLRRVSKTYS